jgi:DNA-binding transcriptional MerR regulator/mannose-6-phosphate isomerase-like protein (cupin superfamily)
LLKKSGRAKSSEGYLKIGDVARRVDISPSVLRSWEKLGLTHPKRTSSSYRLYTPHDVRILKRARYLRRVRGLNAPAILQLLRQKKMLRTSAAPARDLEAIGKRLRQARLQQGNSLAEVATSVGISVGFLSALERSRMSASVGTLRKIAGFYKLNILDLFDAAGSQQRLVRPGDRKRLQAGPGLRMDLLAWGDTVMEPHLFHIAPGTGSGESYSHDGEEFLFVLRGELTLALDGQQYRLRPGDSFYFESDTPHEWVNLGKTEAAILWINTPPTF